MGERYELIARIGKGGMGDVWRAFDHELGRDVCVKRLAAGLPPGVARELRGEAKLLARLRHANVVSLLDVIEDADGAPALVLELIDGLDLRTLCARLEPGRHPGFLPDRVAVSVACSLLGALAAASRALPGLVHRDVTPHNVLVSKEGEVKLTDFGIALAPIRERLSAPLTVKGKFGYMAPEQARGEPLDVRADLFAVGVILYELLTRARPWGPARGLRELRRIEAGLGLPIGDARRIDRALGDAVGKLLANQRENRFESPENALRALAPFGSGELETLRLAQLSRTMEYKIPLHPDASGPRARPEASGRHEPTVVENRLRAAKL